jgi:predicted acylesterase/phospholipase RssA
MTERALVISSSGVRLTYEIAVLRALIEKTPPQEQLWTHVYGTSGGALLASFMCQYPVGREREAVADLEKIMIACVGDNGMRNFFPFGSVQGLLWNKSLHSASFLEETVEANIDPEKIKTSGRHLHIVAVDYSASDGKEYTEADWKIIRHSTIGSCSIPLVFPPHPIPDPTSPSGVTYLGDGGVTDFIPIERALANPSIGHIDAILSVGTKETRMLSVAPKGTYPSIGNIVNTLMEGFYKLAADQTEKAVTRINALVALKKTFQGNVSSLEGLPASERKRLQNEISKIERDSYVSCRLYRPVTPFSLTATGYAETINQGLYDAGLVAVDDLLHKEKGETGILRTLYV